MPEKTPFSEVPGKGPEDADKNDAVKILGGGNRGKRKP